MTTETAQEPTGSARILQQGRNCWRIVPARRVAFLIDGAAYFQALAAALRRAERRVILLSWDFDAGMRLDVDDPETELRKLLPELIARRPELHVYILVWDVAPYFGPSRLFAEWKLEGWLKHPRIHFQYDHNHPAGGTLHEKVVCVDDGLAFVGGIDLTVERWDTPEHVPDDPRRIDPRGHPYPPVHDLQVAIEGAAAAAITELALERWALATDESLPRPDPSDACWPEHVPPDLVDRPVAITRTRPGSETAPRVTEVMELNRSALAAARRSIYIETQYFSNSEIADILAQHLERPDGPEVVLVIWRETAGLIERYIMGSNRERLLRRLARADRHGRLRAYYLAVSDGSRQEIGIHAKLVLVDDMFVRIGSSNLNHRSQGLDSECDIAIEAFDEATARTIAGLRHRLLAEHLACRPDEVQAAVEAHGLIGAIERLQGPGSRLRAYQIEEDAGSTRPFPGTTVLDPEEPVDLDYLRRHFRDGRWRRP